MVVATRELRQTRDPHLGEGQEHGDVVAGRLAAVDAYQQAWRYGNDDAIRSALAQCWTTISCYVNPFVDPVVGVEALAQLIIDYPVIFPDAMICPAGEVALNHGHACYRWVLTSSATIRVNGANYGRSMSGHDVIEFDEQGQIRRVLAFIDAPQKRAPRPHRTGA
jgi:hypothetical protein